MILVSRGVRRAGLICATAVLTLLPAISYGLGLGPIKVTSALNEPLDATIEFTSITDKELQTLEVGLAPVGAFQAVGIERSQELNDIQFLVEHHPDGRPFLRVTTRSPFPEPYLHLLVQAEWAGGRLRREYTALIDPPFLNASKPSGIEAPKVSEPPVAKLEPETAPTPAPKPQAAPPAEPPAVETRAEATPEIKVEPVPKSEMQASTAPTESTPPPVATTESTSTGQTGSVTTMSIGATPGTEDLSQEGAGETPQPIGMLKGEVFGPQALPVDAPDWANTNRYHVKRGDTAWKIAQRIRRDRNLSLEQVVLALYDANPKAFFGKNVNNLKAGKILRIPDKVAVTRVSRAAAHHDFVAQYDVWQEYKLKLARSKEPVTVATADNKATTTAASSAAKTPAPQTSKPKHAGKPAPKGAHAAKPAANASKAKAGAKAKPNGIQLPPTREARKAELLRIVRSNLDQKATSAGKSAESENKAAQEQKLDQSVTRLNGAAAKPKGAADAKEAGKPMAKPKPDARPVEIPNTQLAQTETKSEAKPKAGTEQKAAPAKPKAHKPLRVQRRPSLPRHAPPAQPKEDEGLLATAQGMLSSILGDQFMLMLVGGVVVLALGVGTIYVRRRRRSLTEFEESILTSGDVATSEFSTDSEDHVSSSSATDTSFLSDFSQGGLGNISTDEVDPVAEADVYLAYGRDEQAEEILKDAVVKNPNRNELKEKLLEIYANRSDVSAFETLAEELYASLQGQGGPLWDRVVDMGRKLAPDNPMFSGGGAPAAPAPAPAENETLALGGGSAAVDTGFGEPEAEPAADLDTSGLNFDMGGSEESNTSLEMDMDLGGAEAEAEPEEDMPSVSETPSNALDFNFDMDTGSTSEPEPEPEAQAGEGVEAVDTGGLEFTGLGDLGTDLSEDSEEVSGETDLEGLDLSASDSDSLSLGTDESESLDMGISGDSEALEEEGGLSDSESLDFEALRQNTADNNRSGLSLNIDTEVGSPDDESGEVAVEDDVSFNSSDLSFESAAAEPEPESEPAVSAAPGISAEVDEPSVTVGGSQEQWDEAATKLDLAKAYIDMGDADGARSILEEVAVEGNEEQQQQAAELAAQIA
ncbi:MAG: FimV/HubP family polar landmark protein [Acidiferrobacteraceae bacterium]